MQLEYADGKLYVKCSGTRFNEQVEDCKALHMLYDPDEKAWTISAGHLDKVLNEMSTYNLSISEYDRLQIKKYYEELNELERITQRAIYRKFNTELLNYSPIGNNSFQYVDTIRFMNQNRALAAWSTGTGKSYLLAAIYAHLKHYNEVKKAIILTSSIGILNLNNELKKFIKDYDEARVLVVDSITSLKDRCVFDYADIDIIICGYDTFRAIGDAYDKRNNNRKKKVKYRSSPLPLKEWFNGKKGIIFFDECHLLGSPTSLRSKFIDMNLKFFHYRYLMSATPADKEEKMYMLLKVLDKKLINGLSYHDWLALFCELGTRWSRYGVNKDTWDQLKWMELQNELYKGYAVKRGKELLNLPAAYDVPIIALDMSDKHREIYEAFTYDAITTIKARNNQNKAGLVENLLNTFTYLQMGIDNPLCLSTTPNFDKFNAVLQKAILNFNYEKHFEKLKALDAIVEDECDENDNKIIIFYYHPKTLEALEKHFSHIKTYSLSSSVDKQNRMPLIEEFKKSDAKILLASIMIANTSFTLTECKAAVFYERPWDGITYEQARGRIYRVGQKDEVRYYNLLYKNSIDSLQLTALDKKNKVFENLIKKNVLSPDEWKLIFNGDMTQNSYSQLFS
jgi:SNF2 family DNA or RNA helicase